MEDGRPPIAQDSRPPEETESGSRHSFVVRESAYVCSRCGAAMKPENLEERCPAAS